MKLIISKQFENKTIEYFLDYYKQSKKNKYLLLSSNNITLNNNKVNLNTVMQLNDELIIEEKAGIDYELDDLECDVIYEDEYILVVNKPEGIIVHNETNSLGNRVARYYFNNNLNIPIRHLHRLDNQTQGLVMYSKSTFFQPYLDFLLSNKMIKRYYKAIVMGNINENIIINEPIGRDRHNSKKYRVSKTGKSAVTKVSILKKKNNYTLLNCVLETGRTHQIRVHLQYKNLFIVNDELYGKKSKDFKSMGLYAYKLEWNDIITNKKKVVVLPPNNDLNYFEIL